MKLVLPVGAIVAALAACATPPPAATAPANATISLDEAASTQPAQLALISEFSHAETVARLRTALDARPLTVFAVVDHSAGATGAGLDLSPSTLFIFGNPKAGTPLMRADPRMGLELPLKMLVYETGGEVRIAYPNILQLTADYGIGPDDAPVDRIAETLGSIAAEAGLAAVEPETL